jgi:hypothetical protein
MKSQHELKTMAKGLINPVAKEMLGGDNYEYVVNMMVNFGTIVQQIDEKPASDEPECPGGDLCDGDLPGEWHEKSCPCYVEEVDGAAAADWERRKPELEAEFEEFEKFKQKRAITQELIEVLESLNNPTTWFNMELHSCNYCRASNPGLIEHKPDCKITKLREVIAKVKGEEVAK